MAGINAQRQGSWLRRLSCMALPLVAVAGLAAACGGGTSNTKGPASVLVVGDSLVVAAAGDLTGFTPPGARTVVLAGVGASPCDVWAGYRSPKIFGGQYLSFKSALETNKPKTVVLAFTGNPGLSVNACVPDPSSAYGLAEIVTRYREALSKMGTLAAQRGARAFFSASPARNPHVPEGWVDQIQHGYNGDKAFNTMMAQLAKARGWTYDTRAAASISGADLGWTLYLPCQSAKDADCIDGHQQVRYGGPDAIHCDAPGTNGSGAPSEGSLRFARALLIAPLATQGLTPLRHGPPPLTTTTTKQCSS